MELLVIVSVLIGSILGSALGQQIEIDTPTHGEVLYPGKYFIADILHPAIPQPCIQVGIALAIASCDHGSCPEPAERLGNVLYAGPWKPSPQSQSFTLQVPDYLEAGPATFTLTHLCLLGGGPIPLLEYRNVSVVVGDY